MKFILIKAGEKAEVIELQGDTIDYLKMKEYLQIDSPITCVERKIGSKYYDLWLDDEGLLRDEESRIVSGVLMNEGSTELLIGNMLILKHDEEGNSIGLTDEEIKELKMPQHIVDMDDFNKFQGKSIDEDYIFRGYFDDGKYTVKAHSNWLIYTL